MGNRSVATTGPPVFAAVLRRQRGFSLLELLVALIVVVLFTSLANLTINSGGQDIQLQSTVYNLADVAGYALDEATPQDEQREVPKDDKLSYIPFEEFQKML